MQTRVKQPGNERNPGYRSLLRGTVLFFGALGLLVSVGLGESRLIFPRVSYDDTITGLAFVNPLEGEVTVTLTAYQSDGTLLSGKGVTNPVTIKVAAQRQYAQTTSALFGYTGQAGRHGWCEARSDSSGLTGFFLVLKPDLTSLDGADLPALANELVFHEIRVGTGYETEINLVNPNAAKTPTTLRLVGWSGGASAVTTTEKEVEVPANGVLRLNPEALFQNLEAGSHYYLVASASRQVAGFAVISGPGDQVGSNAIPSNQLVSHLYFPQIAVLNPILTELTVTNRGDATVILTITAHQPKGSMFGPGVVQQNPVTRSLPPGAILQEDVASMFGFSGEGPIAGWLEVESSAESIDGSVSYSIPSSNSWAAVASAPEGKTRAIFSHIATTFGYYTGIALLNPGALAANVRVVAVRADGSRLGIYTTALQPGQRISNLVTELIPDAVDQGGGFVWVSSDVPLFMSSLFGHVTNGVLANIPPQPVSVGFQPDSDTPRYRVQPQMAVLQPSTAFTFKLDGATGPVQWSVNGQPGGSAKTGTISTSGRYSAPAQLEVDLPVTVSGVFSNQKSAASVDLLAREQVLTGRGLILSVAYLRSLSRLYTAELSGTVGLGVVPTGTEPAAGETAIFDVTAPSVQKVLSLPGEEVSKMIPFEAGGQEFLLLAAKTSGKVISVDPVHKTSKELVTGLASPTALVIDPLTGDLLVAEANRVSVIPASTLQDQLAGTGARGVAPQARSFPGDTLYEGNPTGLSVDQCSGNLFISDGNSGEVVRFNRSTRLSDTIVSGLNRPTQQFVLYRKSVSCPQATHILVIEPDAGQVALVLPESKTSLMWAEAPGVTDIASGESGVYLSTFVNSSGSLSRTEVPGIYEELPVHAHKDPVYASPRIDLHFNASTFKVPANRTIDVTFDVAHAPESEYDSPHVYYRRYFGENCTSVETADPLPATVVIPPGYDLSQCRNVPSRTSDEGGLFEAHWEPFLLGDTCHLEFQVRFNSSVPVGTKYYFCGEWGYYWQVIQPGY
jgi:hypothetical protein